MALIRQAEAHRIAADAVVLDLGAIERDAAAMRARAKTDVERILKEGQQERTRLVHGAREQGHKAGFDEGRAAGLAKGREEGIQKALDETRSAISKLEQNLLASLSAFEAERADLHADARQRLLTLAVQIAEKITRRAIDMNPALVTEQVAAVLEQVTKPTRLILRISPMDAPTIAAAMPNLAARLGRAENVELVQDPALSPGSVILRTAGGAEVNASIEEQLVRLARTLLGDATVAGNPNPSPTPRRDP